MIRNHVILCLLGISTHFVRDNAAREAIIRGTLVRTIDQYPYQVSIQEDLEDDMQFHLCGGGIISDNYILTIARCVTDADGNFDDQRSLCVVAGTTNAYKYGPPAVIVKVKQLFMPIEYRNPIDTPCDIAVLMLTKSLELWRHPHLKPLKLPSHSNESYVGKTGMIAGFGWDWYDYEKDDGGGGGDLRFAEAVVLRRNEKGYKRHTHPVKQICAQIQQHPAKTATPRGMCIGDAGSPLVYEDTVIGIESIGQSHPVKCSEKYTGSIYTSVPYYLQFIKNAMNYDHAKHQATIRSHKQQN